MTDTHDAPKRRRRRHSHASGPVEAVSEETLKGASWVVFLLLAAMVLWAPLPLGSNRQFFIGVLSAMAGVAMLVWAALAATRAIPVSSMTRALWPGALALSVALTVVALQMLDMRAVDFWLGTTFARDLAHPVWQLAGEALDRTLPAYISVNPAMAIPALLKTLTFAAVFFLAFELSRQEDMARNILWLIAIAGAGMAVIGFVQLAGEFSIGGWLAADPPDRDFKRFGSTFANANSFATYAGIALIAALALTHETLTRSIVLGRGRAVAMRTFTSAVLGDALPGVAAVILLMGAVFLTGSRAGALAAVAGCAVLALFLRPSGGRENGTNAVALYFLGAVMALGVVAAVTPILLRFEAGGADMSERFVMAGTALDAAVAAPLTGNGFGAFAQYYSLYATVPVSGSVPAAHNDYAQVVADLGFVGGGAFLFAAAFPVWLCLRGVFRRKRHRIYSAVGLAAGALCAVHSFFDFSLQIPGVGVVAFAAIGMGAAQSWSEKPKAGEARPLAEA
jgi:O-antigen ligase